MTPRELDAALARLVEPTETLPPISSEDGELAQIGLRDTYSPLGMWLVVSVYEEGDVPRWDARNFTTDPRDFDVLWGKLTPEQRLAAARQSLWDFHKRPEDGFVLALNATPLQRSEWVWAGLGGK